jgi:hypothetical protein
MSQILFLFVIQALLDTFYVEARPILFSHFPENNNGNLKTYKGRLLSQKSLAKRNPFEFRTSFFVDNSFFIFQNFQELQDAITQLNKHFARFRLTMNLGSESSKSKMECMNFPATLKDAKKQIYGKKYPKKYSLWMEREPTSSPALNALDLPLPPSSTKTSRLN